MPVTVEQRLDTPAIKELALPEQWVLWKLEIPKNGAKPTKVPYCLDGQTHASSTDPYTWAPFGITLASAGTLSDQCGIGYVFVEHGDLVGVDLDGCRDPDTGRIAVWAQQWIDVLCSYCEVSPSGTGVKLWVHGSWPDGARNKVTLPPTAKITPLKDPAIEVYCQGRYFAVTGLHLLGTPPAIMPNQTGLDLLYVGYFENSDTAAPTEQPILPSPGLTDEDALGIARQAGPDGGAKFRALYDDGDVTAHDGQDKTPNAADLALVSMLLFYTGDDLEQLDRLFRASALYRASKWGRRKDYRERTIKRASRGKTEVYSPAWGGHQNGAVAPPPAPPTSPPPPSGQGAAPGASGAQSPPPQQPSSPSSASATVGSTWPDPVSLDGPPAAPLLRAEWFPEVLWRHAEDVAERQQSPIDFVIFTLLVAAATAIGRGCLMRMRDYDDWFEPAGLWVGNIGEPSSMKTPAQHAGLRTLRRLEVEANNKFEADYAAWCSRQEAAKAAKQEAPQDDPQPVRKVWVTDDYTTEKLPDLLQPQVSRGLAVVRDELSGVISSLNKYRGGLGDDRQVLLEAYNGLPRTVNRVKKPYTFVPCLLVNIVGGIQTDLARGVFHSPDDKDRDGLAARFISIWPDIGTWVHTGRRPDIEAYQAWGRVIDGLARANWGLRLSNDEIFDKPHARFDGDGQALFLAWHEKTMATVRGVKRVHEGALAARVGKYPGLFGRLALVLHLIEWAVADERAATVVNAGLVEHVAALLDQYLLPMDRRVYEAYSTSRDAELGKHIAEWIKRTRAMQITGREARRAVRGKSDNEREVDSAMEWLCSQNWLQEAAPPTTPRRGRPSSEKFLVNPKVH